MFTLSGSFRSAIAVASLVLLLLPSAHAQKWSRLAAFPEPAEELYGITAGGKLYVFGGQSQGWRSHGLVYEYDPESDRWTKKKPMVQPLHHVALAESNGKIYVMGGFVSPPDDQRAWAPVDDAWEYDPANDTWKALAPMLSKRGAAVAAVVGGKIYVIGGAGTHTGSSETAIRRTPGRPSLHRAVATVDEYDLATNSWRERNPMPTARNHAAVGVVGGKVYVIGGRIGSAFMSTGSNVDIVEEYDPAADQWGAIKAPMPTPRSGVAWGVHRGRIYVAGGEVRAYGYNAAHKAVEAYDAAANRWITLPPMIVQRHGLAGGVIGNRLHLVSGVVQSQSPLPGTQLATDVHEVLELEFKAP